MTIKELQNVRRFGLAVSESINKDRVFIECDKIASMNFELKIRHGKTLKLRNLPLFVSTQPCPDPLIGRPILEALGLDTQTLLIAACDRHEGNVDAQNLLLEDDYAEGSVVRILEGIYHSSGEYMVNDEDAVLFQTLLFPIETTFTSKFWEAFMNLPNVDLKMSTPSHPQTDVQSEVLNCAVATYLRIFCNYHQDD